MTQFILNDTWIVRWLIVKQASPETDINVDNLRLVNSNFRLIYFVYARLKLFWEYAANFQTKRR